jgi:hypothetical protein
MRPGAAAGVLLAALCGHSVLGLGRFRFGYVVFVFSQKAQFASAPISPSPCRLRRLRRMT